MRLTVVGCSGSVPGPASASSCYLLEADEGGKTWRIALDFGSGALGPLQRYCDPRELDAVAVSHLHPDHCADLASLHAYLHHHPDGEAEQVAVFAPFGTPSRVRQLRGSQDSSAVLNIHAWQAGTITRVGPFSIRCEAVDHPVPAYAFRIEGPREDGTGRAVLTYSGDSDACERLDEAAASADVFLCEASYLEGQDTDPGVHLTAARAAETAARADVAKLVLTHIPPWNDPNDVLAQARPYYEGPLELAVPGMVIEF